MEQIARNLTEGFDGFLNGCKFLIHDRDPLSRARFQKILVDEDIESFRLPKRSPNLNAFAERFGRRSINKECLDQMIFFSEKSLRYAISEYVKHYHAERNHKGLVSATIVAMPVAAVNQDDRLPSRKYDIRPPRKFAVISSVNGKPIACTMQ